MLKKALKSFCNIGYKVRIYRLNCKINTANKKIGRIDSAVQTLKFEGLVSDPEIAANIKIAVKSRGELKTKANDLDNKRNAIKSKIALNDISIL